MKGMFVSNIWTAADQQKHWTGLCALVYFIDQSQSTRSVRSSCSQDGCTHQSAPDEKASGYSAQLSPTGALAVPELMHMRLRAHASRGRAHRFMPTWVSASEQPAQLLPGAHV